MTRAFALLALLALAACGGEGSGPYVGASGGVSTRIGGSAGGFYTHTR